MEALNAQSVVPPLILLHFTLISYCKAIVRSSSIIESIIPSLNNRSIIFIQHIQLQDLIGADIEVTSILIIPANLYYNLILTNDRIMVSARG
jgi:hypothetical protein